MGTTPPPKTTTRPKRFGRYRLLDVIGRGGMAEVYRAVTQGPGGFQRQFVLKRIRAEKTDSKEFVDMFINEARISALLEHPNIVQVYDFGEVQGDYFLAMEYLRGRDLLTVMRHLRNAQRDLPMGIAAFVAMETARGLAYAHGLSQGGKSLDIVHRDVTPSNIMLLKTGGIKLLDFGIARAAMKLRSTTPASGLIKGKFAYLSPEQVRGKGIDGRSDIFSLGVVLWECLAGQRLFWDPNDLQTMRNILDKPVPPPSLERAGLPPALDDVVLRALDRDPERRFPNAAAMADALSSHLSATRFSSESVARLLEELFGSESFNEEILPDMEGTPIPVPALTPRTLIAQARAGKTPTEMAEEDAGYSVVTSVKPLTELMPRRGLQAAAVGAIVTLLGVSSVLGWRLLHQGGPVASSPHTGPVDNAVAPAAAHAAATPQPASSPVSLPASAPPAAVVAASSPPPPPSAPAEAPRALPSHPVAPVPRAHRPSRVNGAAPAPATAAAPAASGTDVNAAKEARERGLEALATGQVQKARMALETAVTALPHDAEVLGGLGEAAFEMGDLNAARSFAKRAATAAPRALKHQILLADVSLKMNRLKEAVDAYRAASVIAPHDASVRARLQRAEAALSASP